MSLVQRKAGRSFLQSSYGRGFETGESVVHKTAKIYILAIMNND